MRNESLYARLADSLLDTIASGKFPPGARLPTEKELCRRHRLSRVTVRQALDILQRRGWIERFPGRGSFVKDPRTDSTPLMDTVYDIIRSNTDTDTTVIDWKLVTPSPTMRKIMAATTAKLYRLRALRSQAGVPVYYTEIHTPIRIGAQLQRSDLARWTILELIGTKLGERLLSGSEDISATAADDTVAKRLRVARGAPVLLLELRFCGADGEVLEFAKSWYRSDRTKIRKELRPSG